MFAETLQLNKNFNKVALASASAIILTLLATPQINYYEPINLAFSMPSVYKGSVTKEVNYEQNMGEEMTPEMLQQEKARWNNDVRNRYRGGTILTLTDGVKHIRLVRRTTQGQVKINVVEMNQTLNPKLELTPVLAANNLAGKASIKNIAQKSSALVSINATFFKPQNGIPLGTLMIDKKLYTGPIYNRVALGIKNDGFVMDRVKFEGQLKYKDLSLNIDNINQPRMLSTYLLVYNKDWGQTAPPPPKHGINIAIENGKIIQIANGSITIPKQGYIISGPKQKLEPFFNAQMEQDKKKFLTNFRTEPKMELVLKTLPEWNDVNHIVSGGPYLVKDGQIFVDIVEQKLLAIGGRNPRTAVGYTQNNEFIMITIDGREQSSVGMTLTETAKLMKSFGCIWAMNLDGGGSSIMYVNNKIVNNPSVKGGIALSNALVIKKNS